MIKNFENILEDNQIEYLLNLPQVLEIKEKINYKIKGSEYFSINIPHDIQEKLNSFFGLNLTRVPMRWIKGDTPPHKDRGERSFENTHLIYLTNSEGSLLLDNRHYPIRKNTGYIFSEGLSHETVNTGENPRLLIGPMSEQGFSVGSPPTYIRQDPLVPRNIQFSNDEATWNNITWPFTISAGGTNVIFTTDITLTNADQFFICGVNYIYYGQTSLKAGGIRPKITVDVVTDYPGLIQNGNNSTNGQNNIYVYNLEVLSTGGSSLASDAGWLGQTFFAKGANNNYLINCYSDGVISLGGGGIIGSNAANNSGELTIRGCSSSNTISNDGGGIIGQLAGLNGGIILCESCWSSGSISNSSGGILGYSVRGNITVNNCYSTGDISINGGGIIGSDNKQTITVSNCYSKGDIDAFGGGIIGYTNLSGQTQPITITNCYSFGSIKGSINAGGIYGNIINNPGGVLFISNCYTVGVNDSGSQGYIIGGSADVNNGSNLTNNYAESNGGTPGTWSDTNANTALTGVPSPYYGSTWSIAPSFLANTPYELSNMGYSPYVLNNINVNNLNNTQDFTLVAPGDSSDGAIKQLIPNNYQIIQGGDSTISIDSTTGVISTTSSTPIQTYTLYIRNNGSYNFTTLSLIVNCLHESSTVLTPDGYKSIRDLKTGDLVTTDDGRNVEITKIKHSRIRDPTGRLLYCISKDAIKPGYPSQDVLLTEGHSILLEPEKGNLEGKWIMTKDMIGKFPGVSPHPSPNPFELYHFHLPSFFDDNLVINNGFVVESLGDQITIWNEIGEGIRKKDPKLRY